MLRNYNNGNGNDNNDNVDNFPTTVLKIRYAYANDSAARTNKSILTVCWRVISKSIESELEI